MSKWITSSVEPLHLASQDYDELSDILEERPPLEATIQTNRPYLGSRHLSFAAATAEQMAQSLIAEHLNDHYAPGVQSNPWSFKWNNRSTAFGLCSYPDRTIQLSKLLCDVNTEETIRDTLLHEIAHALVGVQAGHGPIWQAQARAIGADPNSTSEGISVAPKVVGTCPNCAREFGQQRMPSAKNLDRWGCPDCRNKVDDFADRTLRWSRTGSKTATKTWDAWRGFPLDLSAPLAAKGYRGQLTATDILNATYLDLGAWWAEERGLAESYAGSSYDSYQEDELDYEHTVSVLLHATLDDKVLVQENDSAYPGEYFELDPGTPIHLLEIFYMAGDHYDWVQIPVNRQVTASWIAANDLLYHWQPSGDSFSPTRGDSFFAGPIHLGTLKAAMEKRADTGEFGTWNPDGGVLFTCRIAKPTVNDPSHPFKDDLANAIADDAMPYTWTQRPGVWSIGEDDPVLAYYRQHGEDYPFNAGIWYKNTAEDYGSISIVVPNASHLTVVKVEKLNSDGLPKTASWTDVQSKAKRIKDGGGVRIISVTGDYITAHVQGDHGVYESTLQRGSNGEILQWVCSCPWFSYSFGRSGRWKKYEGRMCGHCLALQYQAQSEGIFNRKIKEDIFTPEWDKDITYYTPPNPNDKEWRVPAMASKTAALSLEAVISVAEMTMERAGQAGRAIQVPDGHVDDPAYQAAIAPLTEQVREWARAAGIGYTEGIHIYTSDYTLRTNGNPQAMVTEMGSIVTRPQTNEMTILHEIAHLATHSIEGAGGHTPAFARDARDLYDRFIGPEAANIFWKIVGPYVEGTMTQGTVYALTNDYDLDSQIELEAIRRTSGSQYDEALYFVATNVSDESRDSSGQWTSDGNSPKVPHITKDEARGDSKPVTASEFEKLHSQGKDKYDSLLADTRPAKAFDSSPHWQAVKSLAFDSVQESWGGQTIDPATGAAIDPKDGYSLSIKSPEQKQLSVSENASEDDFAAMMDHAKEVYADKLKGSQVYLGVFRDNNNHRIDIDPVAIVQSKDDVDALGAYTHAIGGAYEFATGNGHFPPHVAARFGVAQAYVTGYVDIDRLYGQGREDGPEISQITKGMRVNGFDPKQPISISPDWDPGYGVGYRHLYLVMDGNHRYYSADDLNLKEVPAVLKLNHEYEELPGFRKAPLPIVDPKYYYISKAGAKTGAKDVSDESRANDGKWTKKRGLSQKVMDKIDSAPKPTKADFKRFHRSEVDNDRAGGELRGNSDDRHSRTQHLLKEFGDGTHCKCAYCSVKLNLHSLTQDKIYPECGYRLSNILPACITCNQGRSNDSIVTMEHAAAAQTASKMAEVHVASKTESLDKILNTFAFTDGNDWAEVASLYKYIPEVPEMQAMQDDISAHGIKTPIVIDYSQTPPKVLDGHTRLAMAERLGITTVPVLDYDESDYHLNHPYGKPYIAELHDELEATGGKWKTQTTNYYAGICNSCGGQVAPTHGHMVGKVNGKWVIAHNDCENPKSSLKPRDSKIVEVDSQTEATLNDEPEPALPTTDGAEESQEEDSRSWLMENKAPVGNADIAKAAKMYLESVKTFSYAEQRALIDESPDVYASNLGKLDITGTHYESLEEALSMAEAEGENIYFW